MWQWEPVQEQLTQHKRGSFGLTQVKLALWPFGSLSFKPIAFKGTWSGLEIVRTPIGLGFWGWNSNSLIVECTSAENDYFTACVCWKRMGKMGKEYYVQHVM